MYTDISKITTYSTYKNSSKTKIVATKNKTYVCTNVTAITLEFWQVKYYQHICLKTKYSIDFVLKQIIRSFLY